MRLLEIALIVSLVLISGLALGWNMFHYPYYEADEGTYMSQAWSVVTQGKLAPYTYTYDHAPTGWFLIALWTTLSGGFFTFGFSLNSGRVLMLILHLFSVIFLYLILKRLSKNIFISTLGAAIFALSPLGIFYERRVLLDNIMIFWVLLSLLLLLLSENNRRLLFFSGLVFGISVVSKETAIIFAPLYLYYLFISTTSPKFSPLTAWFIPFLVPPVIYLLYVFSQGGFFPGPHPSLITSWTILLHQTSSFSQTATIINGWFMADPVIISLGLIATVYNFLIGFHSLPHRIISLFSLFYLFFLLHGGLLLEFYIIPLIPIFAANIALSALNFPRAQTSMASFLVLIFVFDLFYFGNHSKGNRSLFSSDQTTPQIQAVDWILSKNQPQTFIVIDNYSYVDLHARQDSHFKYAEYYWKVDRDTNVINQLLGNNWRNITYIMLTPTMQSDLQFNSLPLTTTAFKNSQLLDHFYKDGWSTDIWQVNH